MTPFRPSDEDIRAYLDGKYGPPSAEAVRIIQDELAHAARPIPPTWCICGFVDDLGDGTCGNCGLRIMTEDDEACDIPPAEGSDRA